MKTADLFTAAEKRLDAAEKFKRSKIELSIPSDLEFKALFNGKKYKLTKTYE